MALPTGVLIEPHRHVVRLLNCIAVKRIVLNNILDVQRLADMEAWRNVGRCDEVGEGSRPFVSGAYRFGMRIRNTLCGKRIRYVPLAYEKLSRVVFSFETVQQF